MRQRNGENIICTICKKSFYVPKHRVGIARFCSEECQKNRKQDILLFNCIVCNDQILGPRYFQRSKKRFCSYTCQQSYRDRTKYREFLNKSMKILKKGTGCRLGLKKQVYEHKEKKCQVCNYSEYDFCLILHHIDNDRFNNELSNIAVLCLNCQKKVRKSVIKLN